MEPLALSLRVICELFYFTLALSPFPCESLETTRKCTLVDLLAPFFTSSLACMAMADATPPTSSRTGVTAHRCGSPPPLVAFFSDSLVLTMPPNKPLRRYAVSSTQECSTTSTKLRWRGPSHVGPSHLRPDSLLYESTCSFWAPSPSQQAF